MHSHYLLSNATARGWELSYVNKIRDRLRNIVRDKTRYWPTWEVGGRFSLGVQYLCRSCSATPAHRELYARFDRPLFSLIGSSNHNSLSRFFTSATEVAISIQLMRIPYEIRKSIPKELLFTK
jgi:hypothetical protein